MLACKLVDEAITVLVTHSVFSIVTLSNQSTLNSNRNLDNQSKNFIVRVINSQQMSCWVVMKLLVAVNNILLATAPSSYMYMSI